MVIYGKWSVENFGCAKESSSADKWSSLNQWTFRLLQYQNFNFPNIHSRETAVIFQLSQAAACDGQVYDITCGNVHNGNHGTYLPLFQDANNN